MSNRVSYPVIDLFAGPGGLGEGFASLINPKGIRDYAFKTVLSIEKDSFAHATLQLRHFFREFQADLVTEDYYRYLYDEISLTDLYQRNPREYESAQNTAWQCVLGEEPQENVKNRILKALNGDKNWVLVGGPPCQAYSLVGRSRMMGLEKYKDDPRHFLYKQYLQILANHKPPVFVMENVKGLLSSKVNGEYIVSHILRDLSSPERAISGKESNLKYKLYSLSESGLKNVDADPASFIVKAEQYGIPQARHRIFFVGIRSDINIVPEILDKSGICTVKDVIGRMPILRSGLSKTDDSENLWKVLIEDIHHQRWFHDYKCDCHCDFIRLAELTISQQKSMIMKRNSTTYSIPLTLENWFVDNRLKYLISHESRSHMKKDIYRYFFAALYAELTKRSPKLSDFPADLLPEHKNVELGRTGKMFSDRFRVQLPDTPSTTITSHISKDGHYFIHYDPLQSRSLTVREAARLQTFPDNYKFEGNRTAQYHQVGNAVPPLLANKIARIIFDVLNRIE
ncbi:MAG: DNA cytosine methyltransferase [Desulfobulbaceae bacterium]|nr:DNA cytosine methyltransferase [Desulfobulbaceae bacterium]